MQIIKNAQGKLETTGSADDEALSEAVIRAKIAADRAVLRRMLEGNEQFFDDPMGKPAEIKQVVTSWKSRLPPVPGVYVACTQTQAIGCFADPAAMDPLHYAYFDGSSWGYTVYDVIGARDYFKNGYRSSSPHYWLYLVEAD